MRIRIYVDWRILLFDIGIAAVVGALILLGVVMARGQETLPYSDSVERPPLIDSLPPAGAHCVGDTLGLGNGRQDCLDPATGRWTRYRFGQPPEPIAAPEFFRLDDGIDLPPRNPPPTAPLIPTDLQYQILGNILKVYLGGSMPIVQLPAGAPSVPDYSAWPSSADLATAFKISRSMVTMRAKALGMEPLRVVRGGAWASVYSPEQVEQLRNYRKPGRPRKGAR